MSATTDRDGGDPSAAPRPAIRGRDIDAAGRCRHWHGPSDIVAIRLRCCDDYFACRSCHDELAGHATERWPRSEFGHVAILCGSCGGELSISRYLASPDRCPACGARFNPRCRTHHHLYFDVPAIGDSGR